VIDLDWNIHKKRCTFGETRDCSTVTVDNTCLPLRSMPAEGTSALSFDTFVDRFDPRAIYDDLYRVKKILESRQVKDGWKKATEYLVQWHGYVKKDATWEPEQFLTEYGAGTLVRDYLESKAPAANNINFDPDLLAVVELMQRHKLEGSVQTQLDAYRLEIEAVHELRLDEVLGAECEKVLRDERVICMRMHPDTDMVGTSTKHWS
jgi:hypothetical protein